MGSYRRLRRISVAAGLAGLLTGCTAVMVGQPTPVPGRGRLDVPQPTATQIAVGANPSPSAPRMNPIVAQVRPPGARPRANPYGWLEDVHSSRTRHWISKENEASARALAAIPQRARVRSMLEQPQSASNDVVVEHASYLAADGTRLPMDVVHPRDVPRDGNQPALLTVYRPAAQAEGRLLDRFVLAWVRMGGVYARAQVRDGLASVAGPRGAATLPDRSLALSDLFAAGQSLIDQHYTRRERLGIYGRGFGGMMAGAAVTLRPDFFGVALPTGTWPQYRRIATGNCFPPTLIVTAEHDGNIRPWDGYELAAVLQANQICGRPILIQVGNGEREGGRESERRERTVDELAFAARWLGMGR
jgi:prolyl oligopeptidase PreP (S9A serine peptidase family)